MEESEHEVFELEEASVNPIGCISGKCTILRCRSYQEVGEGSRGEASVNP